MLVVQPARRQGDEKDCGSAGNDRPGGDKDQGGARICLTLVTLSSEAVVYTDDRATRGEEIAWAAGLFDGEGTITLSDDALYVRMRNTDPELVERFHDIIGVGAVYGPYTRRARDGIRRKPVWDWVAREEDGLDALAMMWSWLSARRRGQAHATTGIVSTCFREAARQLSAKEAGSPPPLPEAAA
jgi:hypothetical protein